MASVITFRAPPNFSINSDYRTSFRVRAQSVGESGDSYVLSSDSGVNVGSATKQREKIESLVGAGNGSLKPRIKEKLDENVVTTNEFEIFWDDGYGTKTVKDYLEAAQDIIKPDGGPPRWFCPVDCGSPVNDSPTLLFLPGLDGLGLGLILHHKALGKAFEVRCLHIPVHDRTPFEGLVQFVEQTIRKEHVSSPNKPIYLVGDSFGGCLALSLAARNPSIDLVLVLANPATSFGRSQIQPLLPILEALPNELHATVPYLLSFVMGDPVKMAMVDIEDKLPPTVKLEKLSNNLTGLLPLLSGLSDIIPKDTLLWKLKLLKTASSYANSRLHSVKAEVLVLASGKDNMLPSVEEAKRLKSSLQNCTVRCFKDNGHTLLLEDGLSLLSIIKGTYKYRRSRMLDYVMDYLPPSEQEFSYATEDLFGLLHLATGPVMFSTLEDGKIVRGLAGIPRQGPVIYVGYHMLMGFELYSLVEGLTRELNSMVRGIAHPELFRGMTETSATEFGPMDWMKVMGAVPVSARNFFKLLSTKSHILLYPGGAREALHYKGEAYKLFWPEQPEIVRMAAKFEAKIVPFGVVGEDDIAELVLDYNDLMRIPVVGDSVRESSNAAVNVRDGMNGEVANQQLFFPGLLPKLPGRFYFLMGKPIETKGREMLVRDKESANELYLQIKSEVEQNIAYLLKKREEDPYRNVLDRVAYRAVYGREVPSFKP